MNRSQIENLYNVNKLRDYKLKTTDDLLKVHGIDYTAVNGYDILNDLNKKIYIKFIVNFLNAWGLEDRIKITPKGIYWVKKIEHLSKENPNEEYFTVIGHTIYAVSKNGKNSILYEWENEGYEHLKKIDESAKFYLRFEYEYDDRKEWMHVIKEGKDWY